MTELPPVALRTTYASLVLCRRTEGDRERGPLSLVEVRCNEVALPPGRDRIALAAALYVEWVAIERRRGGHEARLLRLNAQRQIVEALPLGPLEFSGGSDVMSMVVDLTLSVSASPTFLCLEVDGEVWASTLVVGRHPAKGAASAAP